MNKIAHLARMGVSYLLRSEKAACPPYMFSIEATNVCNFKCKFCPQSNPAHQKNREKGMLDTTGFRKFIERIIESGGSNRNVSITLDGEPTLNKNLDQFIKIASESGFFPRFSSNGYALTPDLTDKLVAAGNFLISIDFSSKIEYFEGVRGPEGSFEKVLQNIGHLLDVATKKPSIKVEIVDVSVYAGAEKTASLAEMNDSLRKISANRIDVFPPNIKTWTRVFHNFGGHLGDASKGGYMVCPYPWSQFVASWQGDVVACCRDTGAKTILGNVFEKPVMEIWNDAKYREFRKALASKRPNDVAACSKCDMPYSGGSQRWNPLYLASSLLRR